MPVPRFVLQSRPVIDESAEVVGGDITWMLVSPNARALGRAAGWFPDVTTCQDAISALLPARDRFNVAISVIAGQWHWRVDLDGRVVAISSRAYLRQHECDYNVRRFLDALPVAEIAASVRIVRNRDAWRIESRS